MYVCAVAREEAGWWLARAQERPGTREKTLKSVVAVVSRWCWSATLKACWCPSTTITTGLVPAPVPAHPIGGWWFEVQASGVRFSSNLWSARVVASLFLFAFSISLSTTTTTTTATTHIHTHTTLHSYPLYGRSDGNCGHNCCEHQRTQRKEQWAEEQEAGEGDWYTGKGARVVSASK